MHMSLVHWAENTDTLPTSYFSFIIPREPSIVGHFNLMVFLQDNNIEDITKKMTIATTEVDTVLDSVSKISVVDRESSELHLFATSKSLASLQVEAGKFDLEKLGAFFSRISDDFHIKSINMFELAPMIPRGAARFFSAVTATAASGVDEAAEETRLSPK